MNFFAVHPHFNFGFVSIRMDDLYYRKVFGMDEQFRHWMPCELSTNPVQQNFYPSVHASSSPNLHQSFSSSLSNFSASSSPKSHHSLRQMDSNYNQVLPIVDKVEMNNSMTSPGYGSNRNGIVLKREVNVHPNFLFSRGQSTQLMPMTCQIINEVEENSYYIPDLSGAHRIGSFYPHSSIHNSHRVLPKNYSTSGDGTSIRPCSFCRQNGETWDFYGTHQLKDRHGNVTCPILRAHVCEICGATGSKAHTRTYCPVLKATGQPLKSTAICLKNTLRDSSGKIRKQFLPC